MIVSPLEPTNPTVDNRIRRKELSCPSCPPNKAENAKRKAKHGPKKKRQPRPYPPLEAWYA